MLWAAGPQRSQNFIGNVGFGTCSPVLLLDRVYREVVSWEGDYFETH